MNNRGKPSTDDILALDTKLETYYGGVREKFARDETFYELEFREELDMPKEFKTQGIVLPTGRDFVDTFVDNIDIANARVFANKKGVHPKSEEEAEAFRKFALGVLHMTNLSTDISQWRVAAKHYATHGLAALATFWDADMWPDKPRQKDGESENDYAERIDAWREETHLSLPIVIKAVNPCNLRPDPSNPRQFIIEKSTMLRLDAEKLYPWWKNPQGKSIDQEVEKISYWDKDYHCELIDREPVLRVRDGVDHHRYGFIPYVLIESGLGNLDSGNRPEARYVGILRYIYDLLISESRDYSISDVILSKTAWGGGFLENTGNEEKVIKEINQGNFGEWQQLPPGIRPITVTPQTPPNALNDHLSRTSYYLQAHAAPNSVRGMSEEGVRSAADRRLMIAQGTNRYRYANEAFASGASKVIINCAKLFKNVIPGDLRIWARTPTDEFDMIISKDDLKEPFTCYVEFAPISEDDEYKRHLDLEQLVAAGIVPAKWARTQMSNVDPKAIELDIEKEKLKNDPGLQQMVSSYAAAKLQQALQGQMIKDGVMPPMQTGMDAGGQAEAPQGNVEAGGRLIPPIPQPGGQNNPQDPVTNAMQNIAPPRPKLNPLQGMGGGGNR